MPINHNIVDKIFTKYWRCIYIPVLFSINNIIECNSNTHPTTGKYHCYTVTDTGINYRYIECSNRKICFVRSVVDKIHNGTNVYITLSIRVQEFSCDKIVNLFSYKQYLQNPSNKIYYYILLDIIFK